MDISPNKVIAEFGPALGRIAASYERNGALREELLQEIFLAIVRALPRLADPARLKPFVFRIAHNRAMTHISRRMREPRASADAEDIAADHAGQEQTLIARQRSDQLLAAVRSLSLPYRQVITLVLEGLTYPEIAEALGISATNVGVRVNRAKDQLRSMLDHDR